MILLVLLLMSDGGWLVGVCFFLIVPFTFRASGTSFFCRIQTTLPVDIRSVMVSPKLTLIPGLSPSLPSA